MLETASHIPVPATSGEAVPPPEVVDPWHDRALDRANIVVGRMLLFAGVWTGDAYKRLLCSPAADDILLTE